MIGTRVVVTGAGGFIGGVVARTLVREPDLTIRGTSRDGRPVGDGVEACRLDVCNPDELTVALEGADIVVHCAVGPRATTVGGTRLLLDAARVAGVRRVIHFSSIAVYGGRSGSVNEAAPVISASGRGYGHWKVAAEALCHDAARAGADVIILRPAIVYGPGSDFWIVLPARRLLSGAWGALGDIGSGTCNPIHVRDVASACIAAIRAPARAGAAAAFNISSDETISWSGWYARLAAALGCAALPAVSPSGWRRRTATALACKILQRWLPFTGGLTGPRALAGPSRSELALFGLAATYPAQKASLELGWKAGVGLDEGLAESVAWLRASGLG